MSVDDWALAMYAAIGRDVQAATVSEPVELVDEPDDEVQTVDWGRIATPGGGWIDRQLVASSARGYRRRLLIMDYDPRDEEHRRRIEAALRALDG